MHKLFVQDLSDKSLNRMKKRIQDYRNTKENSGQDAFRAIDLNFFENCVDALIELRKNGNTVDSYEDVVKGSSDVINDVLTQPSDLYQSSNGVALPKYKLSHKCSVCDLFVLWNDEESFHNHVLFFEVYLSKDFKESRLFVVLKDGSLFRCTSSCVLYEDIGSNIMIGSYLGSCDVNGVKCNEPIETLDMEQDLSVVNFTVYQVVDNSVIPCYSTGALSLKPLVYSDEQLYKGIFNESLRIIF